MTDPELLANLKGKTIENVAADMYGYDIENITLFFTDGTQIMVAYSVCPYDDGVTLTLKN